MQIIENKFTGKNIDFSLICENNNEILYFDIETTGLSARTSDLYMIGYAAFKENDMYITLLFNDDGASEPEMLSYFSNIIKKYKYLVSYNGDTFDIPYIKEKYKQFKLDIDICNMNSIDIYKILRKYRKHLHLDSMKQFDMESLIGLKRNEFISGGDLIHVYKRYLEYGDNKDFTNLISHNYDDIFGLISITNALSIDSLYKGDFELCGISNDDSWLYFDLKTKNIPFRFNYGFNNIFINGMDDSVRVKIPIIYQELKLYFSNYKDYYYLPLEDMAVHKSVSTYIDKDHKIKANKQNAYIRKEGYFIPCPNNFGENIFKEDISSKQKYLLIEDGMFNDIEYTHNYLMRMLFESK